MKGSKMVVNENEQLEKFYQDELTQYYFEALGRLIAKKSIFNKPKSSKYSIVYPKNPSSLNRLV